MSIFYKVAPATNPAGDEGIDYAACRRTKSGDYDLETMSADISNATSVTQADVKGILAAYFYEITRHLRDGNPVKIDEIGTFNARVRSKCFAQSLISRADFRPSSFIKSKGIRYTPDVSLKKYVRDYASYKRVSSDLMA